MSDRGEDETNGEFDVIERIRRRTARRSASVVLGVGDDAAVVRPSEGFDVVVSTDLLVEGVHFRFDWTTPELLGHKALAVSLSDMAAMGARPRAAFLSIAAPRSVADAFFDDFYAGALRLADRFETIVAGGDLSSTSGPFVIDAVLVGEVERERALVRTGARPGDDLYASGRLGTSAAGLALLERGARVATAAGADREHLAAHLAPEPRVALGRALVERGLAAAAIDVSDGLSSDVRHLCRASGAGVRIDADRVRPLGPSLADALDGGEQYELLFAAAPGARAALQTLARELDLPLTRVGEFTDEARVTLVEAGAERELAARGWDHFRDR